MEQRHEDNNPDTISFSTDRFSPYAIAYIDWNADKEGVAETTGTTIDNGEIVNLIIIAFVIVLAVMVLFTLHGKGKASL